MSLSREDALAVASELKKDGLSAAAREVLEFSGAMMDRVNLLERSFVRTGMPYYGPNAAEALAACKELRDRPKELLPGQSIKVEVLRFPAKAAFTGVSAQVVSSSPVVAGLPIVPTPVRDLLRTIPTTLGAIQVIRKTSYTPGAAVVAEGAPKPAASATVTVTAVPVQKIAVHCKFTKETYEDLPMLVSEIESELLGDVKKVEEYELLKGTGVSPHLTGLYAAAPALAEVPAGTSYIDQIGAGIGALTALGYKPNGIVVNGSDWQTSKMAKVTGGEYLFGAPGAAVADRLWGLPVAVSSALTAGEWLAGDFPAAAALYERELLNILIATQNEDDFLNNLVTALAELREVLIIKQAQALVKNGTIAPAAAARTRS